MNTPNATPSHLALSRMTMEEVYGRTFKIFTSHLDVYLPLSAVSLVPMLVIVATLMEFLYKAFMDEANNEFDNHVEKHVKGTIVVFIIEGLLYLVVSIVGRAAMMQATAELHAGTRPGWWNTLQVSLQQFLPLLCVVLIFGGCLVATYLGVVVLVAVLFSAIFGADNAVTVLILALVIVCFCTFVVYGLVVSIAVFPSIIVERKGSMESIRRSFELASGKFCQLFCVLLIYMFCKFMLNQAISFLLFKPNEGVAEIMIGTVVGYIPQFFFLPIETIMQTLLYLNLRVEKESMNQEVLIEDLRPSQGLDRRPPGASTYSELSMNEDDKAVPLTLSTPENII